MSAYDNSVGTDQSNLSDGATSNFTIAALAICLAIFIDRNQGSLNSVTIAGQPGILLGTTNTSGRRVSIYYTLTPASGSQNITYDGDGSYGDNSQIFVIGLSVTGASSFSDYTGASGSSGNPTVTVPNVGASDLTIDGCMHFAIGTVLGSQTTRQTGGTYCKSSTLTGSGEMGYNQSEAQNWVIAACRAVNVSGGGDSLNGISGISGIQVMIEDDQ